MTDCVAVACGFAVRLLVPLLLVVLAAWMPKRR
jgi:hypothetical protein